METGDEGVGQSQACTPGSGPCTAMGERNSLPGTERRGGETTGTALPLLAPDPQGLVPFPPGARGGAIDRMRGPSGSQMLCLSFSQISALGNWKHT